MLPLLFISLAALASDTAVSMDDLKAQSTSGRDFEVLRKAEKVKPSERGPEWESIVLKSSKVLLDKVNDEDSSETFGVGKALAEENPHLLKDSDFAYSVGLAGVRAFSSKAVATPYFVEALKKEDPRCKNSEVKDAVVDSFTRPGFEKSKTAANKIAFELCPSMIDDDMVQKMTENDAGLKASCAGLMKAGKLRGVKLAKCKKGAS